MRKLLPLALFLLVLVACGGTTTNAVSTQPSPTATTKPTATPTMAPVYGPAILGSDVTAFIARYGKPTQSGGGGYTFGSGMAAIDVTTPGSTEPAPYSTRVTVASRNAPNDNGWSDNDALAACMVFAPSDAVYQKQETLQAASPTIQRIYLSTSLAQQLPTKEFVDGQLNPTKPGTFGIVLVYDDTNTSRVDSCSVQVGLQS